MPFPFGFQNRDGSVQGTPSERTTDISNALPKQHSFPVSGIRDIAQVLSDILLFTDGDAYYQIYSEDANLRKYHYAWEFENK